MQKFFTKDTARVVEAYIGEYASGKSEISINRALNLKNQGRLVTLVDLDTVEPFYTLRPLKRQLESQGLNVIGLSQEDSFGLGETGAMLTPRARWALMNEGDIILDIGYGVNGARTLNLVEGAYESPELKIFAVVNYSRPMTNSQDRIKEYVLSMGRVDAIIANTHLADETTVEIIKKGNQEIIEAARDLGIPVEAMVVEERLYPQIVKEGLDIPVRIIRRYMPAAMW
ncbi:MAG: hypothetical protein ACOX6I_00965 [Syntrophomonadaceae bacterium]